MLITKHIALAGERKLFFVVLKDTFLKQSSGQVEIKGKFPSFKGDVTFHHFMPYHCHHLLFIRTCVKSDNDRAWVLESYEAFQPWSPY